MHKLERITTKKPESDTIQESYWASNISQILKECIRNWFVCNHTHTLYVFHM